MLLYNDLTLTVVVSLFNWIFQEWKLNWRSEFEKHLCGDVFLLFSSLLQRLNYIWLNLPQQYNNINNYNWIMKNSEACEFKENPSCQFNMSVMGDGGLDNLVSVPEAVSVWSLKSHMHGECKQTIRVAQANLEIWHAAH